MKRFLCFFICSTVIALLTFNSGKAYAETERIPGNPDVFHQIDSTILSQRKQLDKAYELYQFFIESPLMGDENYAVYIAENYILPSKDDTDKTMIRLFVQLNRHSMIGMPAPSLLLKNKEYEEIAVPDESRTKYRILYFYDIDCPNCRTQTRILKTLSDKLPPLLADFYAVYTGNDINRWIEHAAKEFPDAGNRINLADPDTKADFVTLYGVISTPCSFVIDEDGFIIGKNISAVDIPNLIDENLQLRSYVSTYIEDIYEAATPETLDDAVYFIDRIIGETLKDNQMFRIAVTDLFNRFKSSDNAELGQAAYYLASRYILGMPSLWREDFVAATDAAMLKYSKNRLGTIAADLQLKDKDGREIRLSEIGRKMVVYFFTPDCALCNATTREIEDMARKNPEMQFVMIYAGADYESFIGYIQPGLLRKNILMLENCEESAEMFSSYDLAMVPSIYLMDQDMRVLAKDITPFTLRELLQQ